MQENPCRACGGYGHWSKDPECPKNAKGAPAMTASSQPTSSISPAMGAETGDVRRLRANDEGATATTFYRA